MHRQVCGNVLMSRMFDIEQHGMCRVVSYIVQSMSAESAFGMKLTSTIKVTLPPKANFLGNAGDFLINVSFHKAILVCSLLTSRPRPFMQ